MEAIRPSHYSGIRRIGMHILAMVEFTSMFAARRFWRCPPSALAAWGDGSTGSPQGGNDCSGTITAVTGSPGNFTVSGSNVDGNSGDGVLLQAGSSATFEGNTISANAGPGVEIQTANSVYLGGNIVSGNAPDILVDGAGGDSVTGADTAEVIDVQSANNVLTGGPGANTYALGPNSGQNTITNFNVSADVLDLRQTAVGSWTFSSLVITQVGNDTFIGLGGSAGITLSGVNASTLCANNFIFD